MKRLLAIVLLLLLLGSSAHARIVFEATDFPTTSFNGLDKLSGCGGQDPGFVCGLRDATLTRIPTKGVDFFFDDAGQLVAVFAKNQKGQNLKNYAIDGRTNLIPMDAPVPGGALLQDGVYLPPQDVSGDWNATSETDLVGTFHYTAGDYLVERVVSVSAIRETIGVTLHVTRSGADVAPAAEEPGSAPSAAGTPGSEAPGREATEPEAPAPDAQASGVQVSDAPGSDGSDEGVRLQVAVPGIGRTEEPVIKIGHDEDFSLDPGNQRFTNPSYASLQNNDKNTADAIILRPATENAGLTATAVASDIVAMGKPVEASGTTDLAVTIYTGRNELVRYYQEGYLDLPGLFRPNIIGRLSLLVVQLLEFIHGYVGTWGLAIIVLTLLFRAAIWPLISTQTKSMFGMQKLQPKIKELQAKYKDDKEKLTQETMKLYQEAGVNPAGGCLPILLQMPLFIILWRVFVNFEFNEGFLWLPDLGQSDPYYILPVLYVIVMMATSWFSAKGNPQTLRQSMLINLVFVVVIINFPSGVLVYYVVSMLVQVLQYWLLNRNQPAPAAVPVKRPKRAK